MKDSLEQGQPCVIIEGSGRAADILAYGYRHATRQTSGVWALKDRGEYFCIKMMFFLDLKRTILNNFCLFLLKTPTIHQ